MDPRTLTLLLALPLTSAAATAAQTAPPQGTEGDGQGPDAPAADEAEGPIQPYVPQTEREFLLTYKYCDSYLAVVGEELITQGDVAALAQNPDRLSEDPAADGDDLTDQEKQALRQERALVDIVERLLKAEGGKALGYDPVLVDQATGRYYDSQIEGWGGPVAAGNVLKEAGFTPLTYRAYIGEQLYARFWTDARTGRGAGPAGRPVADSYVRPGRIHSIYLDIVAEGGVEQRAMIGERRALATLRPLVLAVPAPGEQEATRTRAVAIRANILDGLVTFDRAVNELALPEFRSREDNVQTIPVPQIDAVLREAHGAAPGLDAFVDGLSAGDLSPVFEGRGSNGALSYFVIYRVEAVQPATERLPFTDPGVQERLREKLRESRDELRIERGLAGLARSTFVLPDSLRRGLLQRGRAIAR